MSATTNIWIAASEGNLAVVEELLDTNEHLLPTSPDENTYTPLHAAASYSHNELLRFLLNHPKAKAYESSQGEAAVHVTDSDGDTPLHVAEDIETATILIDEFGADPSRKNDEGRTPAYMMWDSGWNETSDWLRQRTGEAAFDEDAALSLEDVVEEDGSGVAGLAITQQQEQEVDDEQHDGAYTQQLVQQLQQYSTCEVSDALIKLSHPSGGHLPGISLISPNLTSEGTAALEAHKVCGQVFTVEMVSVDDKEAPKPSQQFVDAAPKDSVMLVSASPDCRNAIWGGLMTARAQHRGVKGVVLDGNVRDLAEHWAAGMTVFSRGHSTLGQAGFTRPSKLGAELVLRTPSSSTFPDVVVHPADLILADVDGVVVVPRAEVLKVVELAEKGRQVDAKCLEDIKAGRSVADTFKEHRGK
ncbi:unnamed protein product [Jaminaea pallidilutea]